MKIIKELFPDCFVIQNQIFTDKRGHLSVPFNAKKIIECIGPFHISQTMHTSSKKSVLRGLHYQNNVSPVSKLISCFSGAIYDVVIDLRHKSQTYGQWAGIHLDETDNLQVFAPVGIAHGFVSLIQSSDVFYYQAGNYDAEASCILTWNDPDLAIQWPVKNPTLSKRDETQGISWQTYMKNPMF